MKQIAIMSGKGGAGKTSVSAALMQLLPAVIAVDGDVNASNLPILLKPQKKLSEQDFFSMDIAQISQQDCTDCGQCQKICAFAAIKNSSGSFSISENDCEGCAACAWVCLAQCIQMVPHSCGKKYLSLTDNGYLVHADLQPGADNSGKLIAAIREESRKLAVEKNFRLILIDGPPGTSCQAIASLTGVDLVLVVLEESLSGLSDYQRLATLMSHFRLPHQVVLNKVGSDEQVAGRIETAVTANHGTITARIPFDPAIPQALSRCESLLELPEYRPVIEDLCEKLLAAL